MDETTLGQLDVELSHAGEATTLSPQMLLLEQLRITPERQLPKMDFLFRLFGKPCFPRRELVAITGKAKSGKTFVTSMLMAKGTSPNPAGRGEVAADGVPCLQRTGDEPLRVLWYDTEQSDESTQDILKNRVLRMIHKPNTKVQLDGPKGKVNHSNSTKNKDSPDLFDACDPSLANDQESSVCSEEESVESVESVVEKAFDVFNVRVVEWKERRDLLTEAVKRYGPDLVIVDGIRDLVNDINDGVLAQEVMEELLKLATDKQCCIVCVLHQNKGSEDHNLRGWIGTELMNKAFEVYACEKMMPERVFKVEQTLTRKYDIEETLYFRVNEEGLPVTTDGSTADVDKTPTDKLPPLNSKYFIHNQDDSWEPDVQRLFLDAMAGMEEVGGAELRTVVCNLANIMQYKFYNKLLQRALDEEVITKVEHDRRVFYRPAPF